MIRMFSFLVPASQVLTKGENLPLRVIVTVTIIMYAFIQQYLN